jgi:hypothetical protein
LGYCFRLFGSFSVDLTADNDAHSAKLETTAVLVFVGLYGYARGLRALEGLETFAVGIMLAIIAGLLAGLAFYVISIALAGTMPPNALPPFGWEQVTIGVGLLITVQGFETSRYLGAAYDARMRVRIMRYAQIIASSIYMVYIALMMLAFPADAIETSETAIIKVVGVVAPILPAMLIAAALASQFSAAIADTGGGGGLAEEMSRRRLTSRVAYLLVAACAIALIWAANVFEIITFASRAFAVYYALQAAMAARLAWRRTDPRGRCLALLYAMLAALAVFVVAAGTPAE